MVAHAHTNTPPSHTQTPHRQPHPPTDPTPTICSDFLSEQGLGVQLRTPAPQPGRCPSYCHPTTNCPPKTTTTYDHHHHTTTTMLATTTGEVHIGTGFGVQLWYPISLYSISTQWDL
jgi:hypothetical protein